MKCVIFENELSNRAKNAKLGKRYKRRGILTLQAFIIVMALVTANVVSAFASGDTGGDKDPRKILTDNLMEFTDSLIDAISMSANTESLQDITTVSGELSYNTAINEAGLNNLLNALEMPQEFAPIAKLMLDAGLRIGFELDLSGIDPLIKLGMGLSVQGETLLNLESAIKKNVLYFGIAELYSKYFAVELDDYDLDVKDIIDEASNELMYSMDVESYNQTMAEIQPIIDYISEYGDELKGMLHEIINASVAEIDEIGYYDAIKVKLNNKNVRCAGVAFDLTEDDAYNIGVEVANILLENRDYLRMTADIVNIANGYKAITVSELKEELEYFVDEEYAYNTGETVEMNLYLDSEGNTIGFNMAAEDGEIGFLADMQNSFEFLFGSDGETVRVYGSLEGELTEANGDLWLDYTPGEWSDTEAFNIKIFEFEGLNLDTSDTTREQDVTLTFLLGELIAAYGDEVLYDVPYELVDYLLNSKLVMTVSGSETEAKTKTELILGDDISMTLNLNLEVGEKFSGVTVPDSSELIYVDDYIMYNVDIDEIFANIESIMAKIEEMGYSIDLLYDLLDSAISNMY